MTSPRAATNSRMPALDGMRYIAAIMVAVFHVGATAGPNVWGETATEAFGPMSVAASYGWVGVPLFFLISGFVIAMSSWGRTPAQFAVSRFVRLFPAYWVCVLATTVVVQVSDVFPQQPWRVVLVNLTMLEEPLGQPLVDNVYWTLWVEMRFYLLFLAVVWLGLNYRRAVGFCLLWSIAAAMADQLNQPWLDTILMPGQSQYFIAGIALFLLHKFGHHLVLWLIVGYSWVMAMVYYVGNLWQSAHGQSYRPASILVTLGFGVMILLAMGKLDWLRWRGLTTLGAASYPLYLLHYVIGFTAIHYLSPRLSLPPVVLLTLTLAVLTGAACLIHLFVERPLAPRLKRALSRPVPDEWRPVEAGADPPGRL